MRDAERPAEHDGIDITGQEEGEESDPAKKPTKDHIVVRVAGTPTDVPMPVARVLLTTIKVTREGAGVDEGK